MTLPAPAAPVLSDADWRRQRWQEGATQYRQEMEFRAWEARVLAPVAEQYHRLVQQFQGGNLTDDTGTVTVPTEEPSLDGLTPLHRKHIQNQRRELARLNQRLNDIKAGAESRGLAWILSTGINQARAAKAAHETAHNQALAVMAATLSAIDNTDRFPEAVNDKYAEVVKLSQETRANLDNTLEALKHILEMAKVVTGE